MFIFYEAIAFRKLSSRVHVQKRTPYRKFLLVNSHLGWQVIKTKGVKTHVVHVLWNTMRRHRERTCALAVFGYSIEIRVDIFAQINCSEMISFES